MVEVNQLKFNGVLREIIKKSLFTDRQIAIILNKKGLQKSDFLITKGAYYRQVGQCRSKLLGLYYSIILLRGLGVLLPDDIDVITRLSDQVSVINNNDVFPEREQDIIKVINSLVQKMCSI